MAHKPGKGMTGKTHSLETRRKMSEAQRGRKLTEEHKQKLSKALTGRHRGKDNPNWKGGLNFRGGYAYLRIPWHPHADNQGYVLESRLVAEETLGRCLAKDEVVHHRDGDPLNNKPENLMAMLRGQHQRLHEKVHRMEEALNLK